MQFQFQTGSIKRTYRRKQGTQLCLFQFQTGSIKRLLEKKRKKVVILSFNSKLVRLKDNVELSKLNIATFQFQTGSIKSEQVHQIQILPAEKFQFQTGSIKSDTFRAQTQLLREEVSIPNWFD